MEQSKEVRNSIKVDSKYFVPTLAKPPTKVSFSTKCNYYKTLLCFFCLQPAKLGSGVMIAIQDVPARMELAVIMKRENVIVLMDGGEGNVINVSDKKCTEWFGGSWGVLLA